MVSYRLTLSPQAPLGMVRLLRDYDVMAGLRLVLVQVHVKQARIIGEVINCPDLVIGN